MHDFGEIVLSKCKIINTNFDYFGPIIILGKENDEYYGLKFSAYNKKADFNKMLRLDVFGKEYNLRKLSILDFRSVVKFKDEDIDMVLSKVSDKKLNSIMETIYYILKELRRKDFDRYYTSSLNNIVDVPKYNPFYIRGDILNHNNSFLTVVSNIDGILKCYKTFDKGKMKYLFKTGDNRSFNIRYDNEVYIDITDIKKDALRVMTSKYFMNIVEATRYANCNNNSKDAINMSYNLNSNYDGVIVNDDYEDSTYYDMNNDLFVIKNNKVKVKRKKKRIKREKKI